MTDKRVNKCFLGSLFLALTERRIKFGPMFWAASGGRGTVACCVGWRYGVHRFLKGDKKVLRFQAKLRNVTNNDKTRDFVINYCESTYDKNNETRVI